MPEIACSNYFIGKNEMSWMLNISLKRLAAERLVCDIKYDSDGDIVGKHAQHEVYTMRMEMEGKFFHRLDCNCEGKVISLEGPIFVPEDEAGAIEKVFEYYGKTVANQIRLGKLPTSGSIMVTSSEPCQFSPI